MLVHVIALELAILPSCSYMLLIWKFAVLRPLTWVRSGQAGGVRQVADYVSKLRRVGKGLGFYEFDKEIGAVADKMGGGDPILPGTTT